MSISTTSSLGPLKLDQLELGVTGTIVVMICRMWDVNSAIGRYLSMDFIISDEKGNLMHCIACGNIAHNFLRLKKGAIYSVKNFTMQPNKDDFCVLRFAHFIVEMDRDTVVRKSYVRPDGFACYPFQLVEFDSLEPTNNKYLIDAIGYVTNVGMTTTTRSGSKTLDFHLANNRGQSVRVTLWGGLGEMLIEKRTRRVGLYPIVLTAMSVKLYNNRLYLSSTLSTMIVDDEQIPVLKQLKSDDSGIQLAKELLSADSTGAKAGTLENLLMIDKIKTKRGWNYPSCGGEKCKKGNLDRKHGRFWCDSCHSSVDYPVLRYRLELEVSDDTAQTVVVMFDEMARTVDEEETGLPLAFTCWIVVKEEALDESGSSGTLAAAGDPKTDVFVPLTTTPSVTTPSKLGEHKKPRSKECHDSDGEESFMADSKTKGSDVGCSFEAEKRRRLTAVNLASLLAFFITCNSANQFCRLGPTNVLATNWCIDDMKFLAASSMAQKRATKLKGKAIANASNVAPPKTGCKSTGAASISKRITADLKRKAIADPNNVATTKIGRTTTGKVLLPRFKDTPEPLKRLLDYTQPATASFRDLIRVYNEGTQPRYAQLWFFNTHNEIQNQLDAFMDTDSEEGVDGTIVGSLIRMLDANSAIAKAFRMARDLGHADATANVELRLLSERTRSKQYNAPNVAEVVALITNDFGDGEPTRDIDTLRVDLYHNVVDAITRGDTNAAGLGKRIVLPINFTGGPRYKVATDIDYIISVELPSPTADAAGYKAVSDYMLHGPCGKDNRATTCNVEGKCSKHFPKPFYTETVIDLDGYPIYRRRDDKVFVKKGNFTFDNKHVVPHNRYLLLKYQAHINVEWCNRSKVIKYLFKYLNKGPDRSTIVIQENVQQGQGMTKQKVTVVDEIKNYLNYRYLAPCEAVWRIFSFDIHHSYPLVLKLNFHLQNQQPVTLHDTDYLPALLQKEGIASLLLPCGRTAHSRQILPVIPKGKRADIVKACINRSELWKQCKVSTLKCMPARIKDGEDEPTWIEIPETFLIPSSESPIQQIFKETYPNFIQRQIDDAYLRERAILMPRNDDADAINAYMFDKLAGKNPYRLTRGGYSRNTHDHLIVNTIKMALCLEKTAMPNKAMLRNDNQQKPGTVTQLCWDLSSQPRV
ncbi:ATP-dependent DNA helicase PIF1-like protein [Tanacetum coccineum]